MKKLMWASLGAAGIACAAYSGAVAYSGHEVREALLAQPRDWARTYPFVEVHELRYDKRFSGATRTTTLKLGCPGTPPLMLTWRDTIRHGPLWSESTVAAAIVDSELLLDDMQRAQAKQLLGTDLPPLTARTVVGLAGATRTDLSLPKFSLQWPDGRRVAWEAMNARWQMPARGVASYELTVPALEIASPAHGGALKLRGLGLRGEGLPLPGVLWALSGKGSAEVAVLDWTLRDPDGDEAETNVKLRNLKLMNHAGLDDRKLLSARSTLSGHGEVGGLAIERFEMQTSMKRLHAPSYETLVNGLVGSACDPDALRNDHEALQDSLLKLLPHNPEIALDRMVVQHQGRQASLSYSAAVTGVTDAELRGALAPVLMAKSAFKLDARVPAAWLEQWEAALTAEAQADSGLAMTERLLEQGFLQRDGDVLAISMQLTNGTFTLNGRAMPLPARR